MSDDIHYRQVIAALRIAKVGLLVAVAGGGFVAGLSYARQGPVRVAVGVFVATICAVALYRLVDLRVHQ